MYCCMRHCVSAHLDGRKTSHMSLSGGGHLNPNGRERDAVSGGLKLHHTEASLKHAHHNAPHPLQEGGNKSHYYHGAKHYLLVDKNKNTYSQDQNKVVRINKHIEIHITKSSWDKTYLSNSDFLVRKR